MAKISPRAFTIWAALLVQAYPIQGLAGASQDQLGEWCGIRSRDTIRKALAELQAAGFLEALEFGAARNRAQVYRILFPALAPNNFFAKAAKDTRKIDRALSELLAELIGEDQDLAEAIKTLERENGVAGDDEPRG